jgi:hypothetical protein
LRTNAEHHFCRNIFHRKSLKERPKVSEIKELRLRFRLGRKPASKIEAKNIPAGLRSLFSYHALLSRECFITLGEGREGPNFLRRIARVTHICIFGSRAKRFLFWDRRGCNISPFVVRLARGRMTKSGFNSSLPKVAPLRGGMCLAGVRKQSGLADKQGKGFGALDAGCGETGEDFPSVRSV